MSDLSSRSLPRLGQALVSDPSGAASGGYALLARSPMVLAEDLDFLERCPGVSEQLHAGSASGPYLSFYPLPSGGWALTQRFLAGRRRGNFHRVVAYTVVIPSPVLACLDVQPLLLAEQERLRPDQPAAAAAILATLAAAAAAEPIRPRLPDLELLPADDPRQQAIELLVRQRDELVTAWGRDLLASWLPRVLAALAAGYRVLLPQNAERFLTLCWSALPAADRLESPWTTHFAPGVSVVFRLANAPQAEEARQVHRRPEEWLALAEESPPESPPLTEAAERWTSSILGDPDDLAERLAAADRFHLSLLHAPVDLGRCLDWMETSPRLLTDGFPDLESLAAFLSRSVPSGDRSRSPWLTDEEVLALGAATLGALLSSPFSRNQTNVAVAAAVAATLVDGGARPAIATVARFVRKLEAAAVLVPRALALLAVALPALEEGGATNRLREELLALLEQASPSPNPAAVRLAAELRADLALALTRSASPAGVAALSRLVRLPGELPLLCQLLCPGSEDLRAAGIILRESRRDAQGPIEPAWVEIFKSVVGSAPELCQQLAPADLAQACGALRATDPSFLLGAVKGWQGEPREAALDELGSWLDAGYAEAHLVIDGLLAKDALDALPPTPALGRLSLRALEHRPDDAPAFALAGARACDATPGAEVTYRERLATWTLSPAAALAALERTLADRRRRPAPPGPATGALLHRLRGEASKTPAGGIQAEAMLLAYELDAGALDLGGALLRLARRAAALGGPSDLREAEITLAVARLLPAPRSDRARCLLELLRTDVVPPSLKDLLRRTLLPDLLEPLDAQLADALAELPRAGVDGALLIAAGRRLGAAWPESAAAAVRFVDQGLEHDRLDAAVSLLPQAAATVCPGSPSRLLASLRREHRSQLQAALAAAQAQPGGWQLAAFLTPPRRSLLQRLRVRA